MLRMPKVLRAFEPRMEIPISRGPFPCLKETPGLSCSNSSTVKAGASLIRSPLTVVMVCPGGFGRAPGPPSDALAASDAGAPCDAGGTTDGVTEISWSGGKLPDDWYDEFVFQGFLAGDLDPAKPMYFPVVQECEQGVHRWIEIPAPGKSSSDYPEPAPVLNLLPGAGPRH